MREIKIMIFVRVAFEFLANEAEFKIGHINCSSERACTLTNKLKFYMWYDYIPTI